MSIEKENNDMLRNQIKEVAHHSSEIKKVVNKRTRVEPWVIAKTERAATDLSDVTHYLDGEKYGDGGEIAERFEKNPKNETFYYVDYAIHKEGVHRKFFETESEAIRFFDEIIVHPFSDSATMRRESYNSYGALTESKKLKDYTAPWGKFKRFSDGGWVLYDQDTEKLVKVFDTESEARQSMYDYSGNANIIEKSAWDNSDNSSMYAKGGKVVGSDVYAYFDNNYMGYQLVESPALGEPYDGKITDIITENGKKKYVIKFENGETKKISESIFDDYIYLQKMSEGGLMYAGGGEVSFTDYKGESIMFEPHFNEYYVGDAGPFSTMDEAKAHIDGGSPMSSSMRGAYERGLFAEGGEIKVGDEFLNTERGEKFYIDKIDLSDKSYPYYVLKSSPNDLPEVIGRNEFDRYYKAGLYEKFNEGGSMYAEGGGVRTIKILKDTFQQRANRVFHSVEGMYGDYWFTAKTNNSHKSGYGSSGINNGCVYQLIVWRGGNPVGRDSSTKGGHVSEDFLAGYDNKWDNRPRTKEAKEVVSVIVEWLEKNMCDLKREWSSVKFNEGGLMYAEGGGIEEGYSYQGNTFMNGEYKPVYKKDGNYYLKYYNPTRYALLANEEEIKNYRVFPMYATGGGVEANELKGYRVNIFKSSYGTSSNIVSDHLDSAILVTDGRSGDSSTVMSDEPYLKLVKRNIFGKIVLSAEPVNFGHETRHKMFGGTFIWSTDSRFRENVSEQPIALHDRVEFATGGGVSSENAEKIAKLEKVLSSTLVPDSVKEKARMEIERLKGERSKISSAPLTNIQIEAIKSIANRTGLRQEAISSFISKNNLDEKETVSLIAGLGRGQILAQDIVTAIVGTPNNEYEKKVITFVKSGEAFKSETTASASDSGLSAEQRDLNKKAIAIVDKAKITNFEALVSEALTDANYHSSAFKFAKLVDSSIKTKEDWYKAEDFEGDEKTRDAGIQIANMCGWDGDKITEALYFVLKMKGEHKLADALKKAMEVEEESYPNAITELTKRQTEYTQEIANRSGLRQGAVAEFVAKNGLTETETLNIVQGLGMGKLKPYDVMSAVIGVPHNEIEKQIVAFAKSNEAFKSEEPKSIRTAVEPETKPSITTAVVEVEKEQPKVSDDRLKGKKISDVSKYVPHRNIESITFTIDGKSHTVKGSDIFDGIYVENTAIGIKAKRVTKAKQPKVTRTQFEEETFEFAQGGYTRPTGKVSGIYDFAVKDGITNLKVVGFERQNDTEDSLYFDDSEKSSKTKFGSILVKNNAMSKLTKGKTVMAVSSTGIRGKLTRVKDLF